MKKTICLIMLVFLSLIFVPNMVYAHSDDLILEQNKDISLNQLPSNLSSFYVRLDYVSHKFVQEHEQTNEYIVEYTLPYGIPHDFVYFYPFIYHRLPYNFVRGLTYSDNSYELFSISRYTNYTTFDFRITLQKDIVNIEYPDGDVTPFFKEDIAMFIGADYLQDVFYDNGFNAGVKSITNKYTSYVFTWTVPFVTLVIISGIYFGFKKEWFKK